MLRAIKILIWLGIALITAASILIAIINRAGDLDVLAVFWITAVLGFVFLVWKKKWIDDGLVANSASVREKMWDDFVKKNGFNVNHVLEGSTTILFDTKARRMAFFYSDGIVEHPYDYIRGWEERWTDQGGRTSNHKFDVYLNNLNRPVLSITPRTGFSMGTREAAANWNATLDLILNGK